MKFFKKFLLRIKNFFYEPPVTPTVPEVFEPVPNPIETVEQQISLLTNKEGIALCAQYEGLHKVGRDKLIHPYLCPANVATIGYGTIVYPNGKKVTLNDLPITKEKAMEYFRHEMDEKENVLQHHFERNGLNFNENEFSALVVFAYNLGSGVVTSKNYTMGRAVLSGDRQRIANAFSLYTKAKNKWGVKRTLKGLVRRRNAEKALFLKPVR